MDVKGVKLFSTLILFTVSLLFSSIPLMIVSLLNKYKSRSLNKRSNSYKLQQNNICVESDSETDEIKLDINNENNNSLNELKRESKTIDTNSSRILTYISCFCGGIFLATSMLSLVPDVANNMKLLQQIMLNISMTNNHSTVISSKSTLMASLMMSHSSSSSSSHLDVSSSSHHSSMQNSFSKFLFKLSKFPLAEFFIVVGVLLIMCIEQIILTYKQRKPYIKYNNNEMSNMNTSNSDNTLNNSQNDEVMSLINSQDRNYDVESAPNTGSCCLKDGDDLLVQKRVLVNKNSQNMESNIDKVTITTNSVVLLIALCVHSVFEGLSIGLQTNKNALVNVITAISIHKCMIAFSLGQQLVRNIKTINRPSFFYTFMNNILFSLSNPLGILIGIALIHISSYENLIWALIINFIKAISCGTFIYITYFEIIPHELNNMIGSRLAKTSFIFLGFLLLALIIFFD